MLRYLGRWLPPTFANMLTKFPDSPPLPPPKYIIPKYNYICIRSPSQATHSPPMRLALAIPVMTQVQPSKSTRTLSLVPVGMLGSGSWWCLYDDTCLEWGWWWHRLASGIASGRSGDRDPVFVGWLVSDGMRAGGSPEDSRASSRWVMPHDGHPVSPDHGAQHLRHPDILMICHDPSGICQPVGCIIAGGDPVGRRVHHELEHGQPAYRVVWNLGASPI